MYAVYVSEIAKRLLSHFMDFLEEETWGITIWGLLGIRYLNVSVQLELIFGFM